MITLILTLSIFNAVLIWYSFLLWFTLKYDHSFKFIIVNKTQLIKYWIYSSSLIIIGVYIFIIRLNNRQVTINIYDLEEKFWTLYYSLSVSSHLIILIEIIVMLIFWILLLKVFYDFIKSCLLALFMYYFQYDSFFKCCSRYIRSTVHFDHYLRKRVRLFTDNRKILAITAYIWPGLNFYVEPKIFAGLLPYLIIFDYMTQYGNISKLFIVLPWYYIYMLLRSAAQRFKEFYIPEFTDLSMSVYKSVKVKEKTIRWVNLPENYKP